MNWPVLALFHRSLSVESRILLPHLLRGLCGLLLLVALEVAFQYSSSFTSPGLILFRYVLFLNLFVIEMAGICYFSSAITEEKEEGTLGLLRMAGISAVSLALGKSASRLIGVLTILIVQLPFSILCVTLGGITYRQILSGYLVLATFSAAVTSVGLFFSVLCRTSAQAALSTAAVLLLVTFGVDLKIVLERLGVDSGVMLAGLALVSPKERLEQILSPGYVGTPWGYLCTLYVCCSVLLFLLSCWSFDRATRTHLVERKPLRSSLPRMFKERNRSIPLSGDPFSWKDFHFLMGGGSFLLIKSALYLLVWLWLEWSVQESPTLQEQLIRKTQALTIGLFFPMLEASVIATRFLSEEISAGTLPVLLLSPNRIIKILIRKLLGCLAGIIPALLISVIISFRFSGGPVDHPIDLIRFLGLMMALHLGAFLSLHLKWVALPLTIAFGYPFLIPSRSSPSNEVEISRLVFFCTVIITSQVLTLRRLKSMIGS